MKTRLRDAIAEEVDYVINLETDDRPGAGEMLG